MYADLFVRVSDGDVKGKLVVEVVVGCEVEFSERGIGDVELDLVDGAEYEPYNQGCKAKDQHDGDDDFDQKGE